jgi:hypothetical protein
VNGRIPQLARFAPLVLAALLCWPVAARAASRQGSDSPGSISGSDSRFPSDAALLSPDLGVPLPAVIDPERYYVGPGDRLTLWCGEGSPGRSCSGGLPRAT